MLIYLESVAKIPALIAGFRFRAAKQGDALLHALPDGGQHAPSFQLRIMQQVAAYKTCVASALVRLSLARTCFTGPLQKLLS